MYHAVVFNSRQLPALFFWVSCSYTPHSKYDISAAYI